MKDEPEITLHAAEMEKIVPPKWQRPAVWTVAIILIVLIAALITNY
jgi:hypothetical protein